MLNVQAFREAAIRFNCPECKKDQITLDTKVSSVLLSGMSLRLKCPCGQELQLKMELKSPNLTLNRHQRRMAKAKK